MAPRKAAALKKESQTAASPIPNLGMFPQIRHSSSPTVSGYSRESTKQAEGKGQLSPDTQDTDVRRWRRRAVRKTWTSPAGDQAQEDFSKAGSRGADAEPGERERAIAGN